MTPTVGSTEQHPGVLGKQQFDQLLRREAGLEVGLLGHDPLEGGAGVRVLSHLHEQDADVVHDLDAHALVGVGDL